MLAMIYARNDVISVVVLHQKRDDFICGVFPLITRVSMRNNQAKFVGYFHE